MLPRRGLAVLLLLPLLLSSAALAQGQPLRPQDLNALHGLRGSLGLRARDWPDRADPCAAWAGVTCRAGRVTGIRLAGLRRRTRAPSASLDALRALTALESFNASGFPLPGPLPAWFPPSLAVLDLRSAGVDGSLPLDLGASGNLTTLVLAGNRLSGRIPASVFSGEALRFLDLSDNNLTGELPDVSVVVSAGGGLGALFNASGNSLYGAVGDGLRKRFQVVDVSSNYFAQVGVTGTGFGNGSDGTVHVEMNCLTGTPSQRSRGDCEDFYKRNGSPLPQASPSAGKKGFKRKHILAGVLGAASVVVVLFLAALVFCLVRRGRRRPRGRGLEHNDDGLRSARRSSSVNPMVLSPSWAANSPPKAKGLPTTLDEFTYEQLHHVTGGFGDDNLVKRGRSGDIYRGALESGLNVVIKKTDLKSSKKNREELRFLVKKPHVRIVPLLGHLVKVDEELLVYKYMAKGDLTTALHRKPVDAGEGLCSLDWITRLKIAIGVAEALCFLHDGCSPPLIHRDIQASSVLLDDNFEVRLGSLSEICPQPSEGTRSFFSRMLRSSKSLDKNTLGPPASCSYDVYCFGKVLLEIITGNFGASGSNDTDSEEWVASMLGHIETHDKESVSDIVDPSLVVDEDHLEEVWAVSIVAKACLNPKPSRRPLARYILKALENPLRVVREEPFCPYRIRSTSSRSSWHYAFHGHSHRYSEVQVSGKTLTRKQSAESQGSDEEENSFSFKRASREMFPGSLELEDSAVV